MVSVAVADSNHSTVPVDLHVYMTSMFGHIDTLLRQTHSAEWTVNVNVNTSAADDDNLTSTTSTTYTTYSVCLPVGTYKLVFVATDDDNVAQSTAAITDVLLTGLPCTETALVGASHR